MKRLSVVLFVLVGIITLFFPIASYAQTLLTNPQVAPNVSQDQHTFVFTLASDVMSSLDCFVIGIDPQGPNYQCLTYNSQTKLYSYDPNQSGGLVGSMLAAIPAVYNIPIHTKDYTQYVANNFGFSKHSYAATNPIGPTFQSKAGSQGTGFQQLQPLLPFWEAMRNLVYLLYVIAFMVIGIGIMLRAKMDPRTVMSIQNQIPRIVTSILLVTFSYAISGILIDAMYVTIYSVYGIAARINVFDNDASKDTFLRTQDDIFGQNPLDFANNVFSLTGISVSAGSEGSGVVTNLLLPREWAGTTADDTPFFGGLKTILSVATGDIANVVKVVVVALIGLLASAILPFIIGVAIIVSLFKLWFTLIKSYVIIIINIILSPFWIFLGVFPGSKVNFESWLRQLIAYLMVFPAVILLFLFAKLVSVSFAHGDSSTYFMPPLMGTLSAPQFLSNLIGVGVILIGPILLDQIIAILKAPTAGAISKAVQGGFIGGIGSSKKVRDLTGLVAAPYNLEPLGRAHKTGVEKEGIVREKARDQLVRVQKWAANGNTIGGINPLESLQNRMQGSGNRAVRWTGTGLGYVRKGARRGVERAVIGTAETVIGPGKKESPY
jgi:hypothetical protein